MRKKTLAVCGDRPTHARLHAAASSGPSGEITCQCCRSSLSALTWVRARPMRSLRMTKASCARKSLAFFVGLVSDWLGRLAGCIAQSHVCKASCRESVMTPFGFCLFTSVCALCMYVTRVLKRSPSRSPRRQSLTCSLQLRTVACGFVCGRVDFALSQKWASDSVGLLEDEMSTVTLSV